MVALRARTRRLLDADGARHLRPTGWFGRPIANGDMHLGNAGMLLQDARPLSSAPCTTSCR
jgi:hypothetical protein